MGWVAVASAAFQGFSAIRQYQQQNKAADAQKRANKAAMDAAKEEARLTREDAAYEAKKIREDAAKVRAQQVALFLKSGVTLDGSPMLITSDTTAKGEENAQNTIQNAESRAKSLVLRGKAGQQAVTRGDIFGTAADVLGSANKAQTAYASKGG